MNEQEKPRVVSVRESPEYARAAVKYFREIWAGEDSMKLYEDCIMSSTDAKRPLPQWYLLLQKDEIIGGAGLITNDFISRMDLYPWICAVYVREDKRGHAYASRLLEKAKKDALAGGFDAVYVATDHTGFYEHYGFKYLANGFHPWGDSSRIYECVLR